MEVTDWRCVSQHYILALIEKAVDQQQLHVRFKPSLLIAAGEDALSIARTLKAVLKARTQSDIPILTCNLEVYDEDANPYNPLVGHWGNASFQGHHILLVDKADNSRTSLVHFIAELRKRIDAQHSVAGPAWTEPQVGVFVLHNKRRPKAADLPAEVLDGRYFAGEECDNVAISYPYNHGALTPVHQPAAHGDHPHLGAARPRQSFEESKMVHRAPSPALAGDTRVLSSHYVEQMVERAVEEQQVYHKFDPTLLIAVCDDSIAPARLLKHHLRIRSGHSVPVLTSKLDLYDEDANPYNPIVGSWQSTSLSGHRVLVVEKVDSTRATLAGFLAGLQKHIEAQRGQAEAAGTCWVEPVLGVFVLHNKDKPKQEGVPQDILSSRYFVAENVGNLNIAYPFHVDGPLPSAPVH